jgi:putative transposase
LGRFSRGVPQGQTFYRYRFHVVKYVFAKVTMKRLKKVVAGLYARRPRCLVMGEDDGVFVQSEEEQQSGFTSAVKCLKNFVDACLGLFHYPEEHWISLRTPTLLNGQIRSLDAEQSPW